MNLYNISIKGNPSAIVENLENGNGNLQFQSEAEVRFEDGSLRLVKLRGHPNVIRKDMRTHIINVIRIIEEPIS